MPTARELLEQADALMRRNRALPPSTSPPATPPPDLRAPLTPSAPVASPRPIQREPIAPSVAHTSLPIAEDDGEFTEPVSTLARAGNVDPEPDEPEVAGARVAPDDADFPVLTDAVDEPSAPVGVPDDDDLPLLTDAVTELGGTGVDEAARGEPSLWDLASRGEASVLGAAPDSVIVVPPADTPPVVPQAPPRGRDPLGFDQPAPGFVAPPAPDDEAPGQGAGAVREHGSVAPAANEARDEGISRDHVAAAAPAMADEAASPYVGDDDEPHVFSAAVAHMPPEDAEEAAVAAGDPPAAEEPAVAKAEGVAFVEEESTQDVQGRETAEAAFAVAEPSPPADSTTPATAFDQQRIREIAEEIGMQVLQRIDIFTDTTLRAQLGERLRPVVDRAAADLVSAINEHVGELLRAQVAEAIEREIESWKSR